MPWSSVGRPSAALGALKGYLSQEISGLELRVEYGYRDVASHLGFEIYSTMSEQCYELGG